MMSENDRVVQHGGGDASYARFWPVLLLPAVALGWYLGSFLTDLASPSSGAQSRSPAVASKAKVLWKFDPAVHKDYVITSNGANLAKGEQVAILRGDTSPTGYQFISSPISVKSGQAVRLTWHLKAMSGVMAVGLVDGNTGIWVGKSRITDKPIKLDLVPTGNQVFVMIANDSPDTTSPVAELGPAELAAN